jgi:hypothetical protein
VRTLLAVLALAIACATAPLASAMLPTPIGLDGIHTIKLKQHKLASCSVQSHKRKGAGKVARKILPVACEQPPRSRVLDAGFVILFAP